MFQIPMTTHCVLVGSARGADLTHIFCKHFIHVAPSAQQFGLMAVCELEGLCASCAEVLPKDGRLLALIVLVSACNC